MSLDEKVDEFYPEMEMEGELWTVREAIEAQWEKDMESEMPEPLDFSGPVTSLAEMIPPRRDQYDIRYHGLDEEQEPPPVRDFSGGVL